MEIISGGIEEQTQQALKNLKAVVEASGSELGKVVKTTVSEAFFKKKTLTPPHPFPICGDHVLGH